MTPPDSPHENQPPRTSATKPAGRLSYIAIIRATMGHFCGTINWYYDGSNDTVRIVLPIYVIASLMSVLPWLPMRRRGI